MEIRNALLSDLPTLMRIYDEARAFMRSSGNREQWQNGYPSSVLITHDISAGDQYVCIEGDEILATFFYKEAIDPTYNKIYEGKWYNDAPYGVIHRIAVAENAHGRGVARFCFDYCYGRSHNLKIDTHRDNAPMQRALLKSGFLPCGIIYLESGDERVAFQKSPETSGV